MDAGTLDRSRILPHTLRRPAGLLECPSVLDVGAGVRPFSWWKPSVHVCVEPFGPYCDVLRAAGFVVIQTTAEDALQTWRADSVLLLDVIEHMDQATGELVIQLAQAAARRQVVVFTPLGFMPQDQDAWGYGNHEGQRHKSGWTPADFPGWQIDCQDAQNFFAIWTR